MCPQNKHSLVVDFHVVPSWLHFFSMSCDYEYITSTCYAWSSHACIVHLSVFNSNFLLWLQSSALFPKSEESARPATTQQQWKHTGCVRNVVLTYCILFFNRNSMFYGTVQFSSSSLSHELHALGKTLQVNMVIVNNRYHHSFPSLLITVH